MSDQAAEQSGLNNQSKVKIKVDGQEMELPLEEVINLAQQGKDYTKKTQALSEKEKALNARAEKVKQVETIVDEMNANPKLNETLNKVYSDFKSGKISKSDDVKDRNLKLLDKRISEAVDAEQKEQLRDIRAIIAEESNAASLEERFNLMKQELDSLKSATAANQSDKVDGEINQLRGRFGKELIDKYEADLRAAAIKYPHQKVNKLLYHYATDDEMETSLLTAAKQKEKTEIERKKNGSSVDGKTVHTPIEVRRDKSGRVSWADIKEKLKSAGKFS